jgi:hypothetical protein
MHEVLEEIARVENTQDQTDHGQREMMQEDDLRQSSNIVTHDRTTSAYSPAAEGTIYPVG